MPDHGLIQGQAIAMWDSIFRAISGMWAWMRSLVGLQSVEEHSFNVPYPEKETVDRLIDGYDRQARAEGHHDLCLCTVHSLDQVFITARNDVTLVGAEKFSDAYGAVYSITVRS